MPNKVRVEANDAGRLTLDQLMANVRDEVQGFEPVGWVLFQDAERADLVYVVEHGTSEWQYVLLNQYSGDLLSAPVATTHHLTDWLLHLHSELLLHHPGLLIAAAISIILCLLGISGVIIYRHFWRHFFTLRWDKRLTVFFTDLHKTTGIIATPILLILGFTGAGTLRTLLKKKLNTPMESHMRYLADSTAMSSLYKHCTIKQPST